MSNLDLLAKNYSFEDLASALYKKGEREGFSKVTDKTKWREPVMAQKLGHIAHKKISAGLNSEEYGSDAFDKTNNVYAEYKTQAIEEKQLNNLFQRKRPNGKKYTSFKVSGVYNGAYKESALDSYKDVNHYFGIFYKEQCILIIKPNTNEVMSQLRKNNEKRKPGKTTNLNIVTIDLEKKNLYSIEYQKEDFFDKSFQ